MAKISIIIPVYNKENYLAETLKSVLRQTCQEYEVILVDDGSTDDSLKVCEEYAKADDRIRVYSVANGGVSKARNIGLRQATGTWIQFLDGDDTIAKDYLEEAVSLGESEQADIVFSGFSKIDVNGKVLETLRVPSQHSINQRELCALFIDNQYKNGFFGFVSNKLFRSELLTRTGAQFPVGITLAEDLDFYSQLYRGVQRASFWDGDSFCYLQTGANYQYNSDINYLDQLRIQADIRSWFIEVGEYEVYALILDKQIANYVYYCLFDASERNLDMQNVYSCLKKEPCTCSCARAGGEGGFARVVLRAYSKGDIRQIKLMFSLRKFARKIYRKFFK